VRSTSFKVVHVILAAVSVAFGLPVGMQIMTRHHDDALLLDLAQVVERTLPWPVVASGAPR
jgi:Asp-tRNA(Asn)/Glu-tRNA(Gln) amidotransferase A subunit family amidase